MSATTYPTSYSTSYSTGSTTTTTLSPSLSSDTSSSDDDNDVHPGAIVGGLIGFLIASIVIINIIIILLIKKKKCARASQQTAGVTMATPRHTSTEQYTYPVPPQAPVCSQSYCNPVYTQQQTSQQLSTGKAASFLTSCIPSFLQNMLLLDPLVI